ncbi:MAG: hypothetical protein PHE59_00310 [Patescibacteria group bacterium]|nr:hypothetical protein [Patescibacteria group bacterium]MDD5164449.1 hypothetical protein [Patescibacteria group bacterium]MDD5534368.1 hypothetical protein [Patescibacteria group bacterium]
MRKEIKKHSDKNAFRGMNRYFNADLVVDSNSWEELFENLERYKISSNFKNQSFNEYKLFNLTIKIEYKLTMILELFLKEGKLVRSEAYKHILETCKKYRRLITKKETEKLLKREMKNDDSNLFSPHVLFYIAGCGLGDILHIFENCTDNFSDKDKIVKQLRGFKDKRNDFTHNLLSSRINSFKLLSRALLVGQKLYNTFDQMIESHFIRDSIVGNRMIYKLKLN